MRDFRIFIGVDPRQPVAYNVCHNSIMRHASKPLQITPLVLKTLPINKMGLTEFTFSRYLPPYLMGFEGYSLFLDADMMLTTDIFSIVDDIEGDHAVWVVKNELRYEWPSVMFFNNKKCQSLTPDYIEANAPQSFEWAESVGELPKEWNHLVNYDNPNENAKLVHFTQGIPCFPETQGVEYSDEWSFNCDFMRTTVSWDEIMGNSVHKKAVKG